MRFTRRRYQTDSDFPSEQFTSEGMDKVARMVSGGLSVAPGAKPRFACKGRKAKLAKYEISLGKRLRMARNPTGGLSVERYAGVGVVWSIAGRQTTAEGVQVDKQAPKSGKTVVAATAEAASDAQHRGRTYGLGWVAASR